VIDYDRVDYFTDQSLVHDPHPYFDHLRNRCPIAREPHYGVYAVTGYEEAAAILKDTDTFSACVSVGGPFPPLPFECSGDDISGLIELNRSKLPMYEHMVTMDPPQHTDARSLLSRLLTPSRLKENEQFMWALADRQLDEFLANGHCEFLAEYAKPFSLLVIAEEGACHKAGHQRRAPTRGRRTRDSCRIGLSRERPEPGRQRVDLAGGGLIVDEAENPRVANPRTQTLADLSEGRTERGVDSTPSGRQRPLAGQRCKRARGGHHYAVFPAADSATRFSRHRGGRPQRRLNDVIVPTARV
jgi:cytochrome P450